MSTVLALALALVQIVGGEFAYTVRSGDTWTAVGARFGVDARVLAEANWLKLTDKLKPGWLLFIDNRHIVPPSENADIVVNIPQRMLFHFGREQTVGYPVAVGRPTWRTSLGDFEILTKEVDPTWDVPVSIQEEMRRAGKPVLTCVPPSPENPLGKYWMGLSLPGIGIHGTNAPASIYGLVTHGCIRLAPSSIEELFPKVEVGTTGRIIYEPVLIAGTESGIFLEVHPDAYGKGSDPLRKIIDTACAQGYIDMLDWAHVKEVIRKHDGIARDVTLR